MGKTAFLIQLMYNIAVIQNKKVLMFNLEMTKEELCKRFIALHTKFSNFEIKQGFDRDMSKYNEMLKPSLLPLRVPVSLALENPA